MQENFSLLPRKLCGNFHDAYSEKSSKHMTSIVVCYIPFYLSYLYVDSPSVDYLTVLSVAMKRKEHFTIQK